MNQTEKVFSLVEQVPVGEEFDLATLDRMQTGERPGSSRCIDVLGQMKCIEITKERAPSHGGALRRRTFVPKPGMKIPAGCKRCSYNRPATAGTRCLYLTEACF